MRAAFGLTLFVGITIVALSIRLIGLGSFMTADEAQWMLRSAEFWHKLAAGDPGGTFMTTHPGAFPMMIIGAGLVFQEHRLGIPVDVSTLNHFRRAATLPITLVTALGIGCIAYLAHKLWGLTSALLIGIFMALDPYLTGLSQIAHLDAVLAITMLISVLSFFVFMGDRRFRWLSLAGVAMGLAWSTKLLPALWLFLVLMVMLVWMQRQKLLTYHGFQTTVRYSFFLFGLALLVFYITWPAMWVKDNLWGSFEHDTPIIVNSDHGVFASSEEGIEPLSFYARTVVSRVPLFYLVLTLGGIAIMGRQTYIERRFSFVAWLYLYGVGYLVLISFIAKKADRYAAPALILFPLIAAVLLSSAAVVVFERFPRLRLRTVVVGLAGIILLVGVEVGIWAPYAIAYNNPVFDLRPLTQQGWGEGLDQVALWLQHHPLGDTLTVASWYPTVLSTYFSGKVMSLSSRHDDRVGFIVTYRNMYGRNPDDGATNVLNELKDVLPVHTVFIHGKPYAWIYDTIGLPYFDHHVGELMGAMEVGQTVTVPSNHWTSIDIGMSTFSGRTNTHDVTVHIRDSVNATRDLRTVTVPASSLHDSDWNTISFDPIEGMAGQEYYVAVTSPSSVPGNAVTVRFSSRDIRPGQMLLRRRALAPGEANTAFLKPEADLAYRFSHE